MEDAAGVEGPDVGVGVNEVREARVRGLVAARSKLTLSKLLEQDRERVDGELYRAAVHRRRTWLRLRLQ